MRGRDDGATVTRRRVLRGALATTAVAGAGAGTASAQETVSYGDWFTDATKGGTTQNFDGTTADERGSSSVTVQVGAQGNGGPFAFDPPAVRVDPGTTVTFEWVSDTHNTIVEAQPEGAGWEGHEPIENSGFSYDHTFDAEGLYEYYCQPHLPLGMKGAIVVGDAAIATPAGGEGAGAPGFRWPGGDTGVAFMALLFGTAGLAVLVVLGGGSVGSARQWRREAEEAAAAPLAEAEPDRGIVRELGHDEFDPLGTATLIAVYFLILVALWVFVYFVEFLGRGPTVIG